ncbi:MAG: bifunctional phosphoribosylaminoimidazolecarboxamide formyltransferase/IMP cyclohydrolase [Deltaproteobacteria bacterium]|nr:bifunctional phosphoribosylaminoimidazolecarboxamide formyltransferase/IMP cyclohydrolase [Deltaproteobacteria bacterium]
MNKSAIVSVYDKKGLGPFVKFLIENDYIILSSGGTAKYLRDAGLEIQLIEEFTGQEEILGGRVKTLHPRIHAGILARRDVAGDMEVLKNMGVPPVDLVVVNLYPFLERVRETEQGGEKNHTSLIEDIDIGGPTLLRAAAKNSHFVAAVCDPNDYEMIIEEIKASRVVSLDTRRNLAKKVFAMTAEYDAEVARYFSLKERLLDDEGNRILLAPIESCILEKEADLRYGENPHQQAAVYRPFRGVNATVVPLWQQLQGKELSYNNLLDAQAAIDLFVAVESRFAEQHVSVIIKHSNPCGVAVRGNAVDAFIEARKCDPVSSFGGIIAVSGVVDGNFARTILEGFVEVLVLSDLTDEARAVFAKKKNVRVLKCDFARWKLSSDRPQWRMRCLADSYLLYSADRSSEGVSSATVVTERKPEVSMLDDLDFAWIVCKHVTSNAIVVAKGLSAIGVGAGQMSRVDSARLALERAKIHGHDVSKSVAASDAFLPFTDVLEVLNDAGIGALIQPGGSQNDSCVIESANERKMCMLFTGVRHFRH